MDMKYLFTLISILIAVSCNPRATLYTATDTDGNSYPIASMPDGKIWLTKNLRVEEEGSYCYDTLKQNCAQYGKLYVWQAANTACRKLGSEWRLPTNEEWRKLVNHFGGIVGEPGDGTQAFRLLTDSTQFNIRLGGGREPDGSYRRINAHGFYWSATETDSAQAWLYNFAKGPALLNAHPDIDKRRAASVRCVKD